MGVCVVLLILSDSHINVSHSRSTLQFDSGREEGEGKSLEREREGKLLCSWCMEEETGTATVLWLRMCLPLPSQQPAADSILGAHYSSL